MTETFLIYSLLALLVILGGVGAWTPRCQCGHRGAWHDPNTVNGGGQGCLKCECKEFKRGK